MALFRHIYRPLAALFPKRTADELGVTARSLFSAVHGMVTLGLEQKLIAVPLDALRVEIALIVRAMVGGWKVNSLQPSLRGALATKQSSFDETSWIASLRSQ